MLTCSCFADFTGISCDIDLSPCSDKNNECINNSTCFELGNREFECECQPFYNGTYCESKIDLCQNETCSNNGQCVEVDNEVSCDCHYLYYGDKCELQTNELSVRKTISHVAGIIAILSLIFFALFIVLMDTLKIFVCRNRMGVLKKSRHKYYKFRYLPK
jgi:hypothetical protein